MQSGFVIAVGTAVLLTMAIFIVMFVAYYQHKQAKQQLALKEMQERHRRELMAATFMGQEEERKRLAADLHDGIGTMLSVTKMSLNQVERHLNGDNLRSSLQVQKTRSMIDETMTNVRRISRDLVPTTLDRFGLLPALEELADRASEGGMDVNIDSPSDLRELPPGISLTLYRISQELINNVIRHARATAVTIQVYCLLPDSDEGEVRLLVQDNGIGFDYDAVMENKLGGLGLRNIESRLSVLNGHVTFDVAPGRGSAIHVQIRLRHPEGV